MIPEGDVYLEVWEGVLNRQASIVRLTPDHIDH